MQRFAVPMFGGMLRSPPDEMTLKVQRPLATAVIGGALCCLDWNIWQGYRLPYPVPQLRREDGAWR
jgi:hypothetical protein